MFAGAMLAKYKRDEAPQQVWTALKLIDTSKTISEKILIASCVPYEGWLVTCRNIQPQTRLH